MDRVEAFDDFTAIVLPGGTALFVASDAAMLPVLAIRYAPAQGRSLAPTRA